MDTNQIIKEQLSLAPKELKAYISEEKWSLATQEVARNINCSQEQTEAIQNEVIITLLGLDLRTNIPNNLKEVGLNDLQIRQIVSELDEKVFKPVIEFLPTETEAENPENLIPQGDHLIEDSAGNKDNVLPPIPQKTTLEKKIGPIMNGSPEIDANWEKRKETLGEHQVVTETYKGSDPYREPLS